MAEKAVMLIAADGTLGPLVEIVLRDLNVTVICTDDAAEAVEQLSFIAIDLLLVDTAIPRPLEAIRRVKTSTISCGIPVVAMACADLLGADDEAGAAQRAGADDILCKPFGMAHLVKMVDKYLYRQPEEGRIVS